MELSALEQAAALLQNSHAPLISIPERPSTDAMAAAIALFLVLEKMGQHPKIVSPKFTLPPGHGFLPRSEAIEQNVSSLRDFIIDVDTSQTKLEALSYEFDGPKLRIHLTPKGGFFQPQNVSTSAGPFAFDRIVILDAPTLEQLGPLYQENAEFFLATPKINIDHHAGNRRYGHVNLVDVVANSVSEIVFELIERIGKNQLDEQVATSLLAGIISKTKAFQSSAITPRSLAIASHLVTSGARREEIVRHLYQTKTVPTLQLWGKILGNLQTSEDQAVVWSQVTKAELSQSGATVDDALGALDELLVTIPDKRAYVLFVEQPDGVTVAINHAPDHVPTPIEGLERRSPVLLFGRLSGQLGEVKKRVFVTLGQSPHPPAA